MTRLTSSLAQFIAHLSPADIPAQAHHLVRRGIADTVGVMFAGRDEPVVGHALSMIEKTSHGARLLGDRGHARAEDAAFVNSVAAHALDYDDTGLDGHPSVVLAPLVLAEGEATGADWDARVAVYVAGYETWAELIGRDADKHHGKGWHPSAVFGAVAAAAATAQLRRLDADACAHALGIAASMAAGLVANFGSMTKPLQVGLAVRNGMTAAALAQCGVTASPDALESPRGFLAALSPAGRVRRDGPTQAGAPWQILRQGLSVKRYPVCYAAHRLIDATLALRPQVAQALDQITRIDVHIGHLQAAMLRASRPRTGLDAKFSAEFAVACALARGGVGLGDLSDARVCEPDVQALIPRVHVHPQTESDPEDPLFSPADHVRLSFADGRTVTSDPVTRPRGHHSRPLDDAELRAKFMDCAQPAIGARAASAWWDDLVGDGTTG